MLETATGKGKNRRISLEIPIFGRSRETGDYPMRFYFFGSVYLVPTSYINIQALFRSKNIIFSGQTMKNQYLKLGALKSLEYFLRPLAPKKFFLN